MATLTLPRLFRPTVLRTTVLGLAQILIWGGSFFLLAVLAPAVIRETGWPPQGVYGSLSVSIFISGVLAPVVGRWIGRYGGNQLLLASGFIVGLGLLVVGGQRAPAGLRRRGGAHGPLWPQRDQRGRHAAHTLADWRMTRRLGADHARARLASSAQLLWMGYTGAHAFLV